MRSVPRWLNSLPCVSRRLLIWLAANDPAVGYNQWRRFVPEKLRQERPYELSVPKTTFATSTDSSARRSTTAVRHCRRRKCLTNGGFFIPIPKQPRKKSPPFRKRSATWPRAMKESHLQNSTGVSGQAASFDRLTTTNHTNHTNKDQKAKSICVPPCGSKPNPERKCPASQTRSP